MIIPKLPVPSCSGAQTYAFEGGLQAAHGGEGLAKHGDIYIYIIMPNISWICMDMYGYVWICMDMYGYVWICMDMYGYVYIGLIHTDQETIIRQ